MLLRISLIFHTVQLDMTHRIWSMTGKQSVTPRIYENVSKKKAEQKVPGFILYVL